jgi:DNA-directed RNA polymerase specialized sigma24 family protein
MQRSMNESQHEEEQLGLNQREVADILGVSRSAIQKTEERALEKLRRELKKRRITSVNLIV